MRIDPGSGGSAATSTELGYVRRGWVRVFLDRLQVGQQAVAIASLAFAEQHVGLIDAVVAPTIVAKVGMKSMIESIA